MGGGVGGRGGVRGCGGGTGGGTPPGPDQVQARRTGEDLGAQVLKFGGPEVAELEGGSGAAGHLHGQASQAEDAPEEGVDDVDGLDPVKTSVTLLAEEDPGAVPDRVGGHREGGGTPGEPRVQPRHQEEEHDSQEDPDDDDPAAALARPAGVHHVGHRSGVLVDDDRQQRRERLPGIEDWGDRVHAPPGLGRNPGVHGVHACAAPVGGRFGGRGGVHRPASSADPRRASMSRRRTASSAGRPSMVPEVSAEAVCRVMEAIPKWRATGPSLTSTYWMRP